MNEQDITNEAKAVYGLMNDEDQSIYDNLSANGKQLGIPIAYTGMVLIAFMRLEEKISELQLEINLLKDEDMEDDQWVGIFNEEYRK